VADRLRLSVLPLLGAQPLIGGIAHRDILGLLEGRALSFLDLDFLKLSHSAFCKIPTDRAFDISSR